MTAEYDFHLTTGTPLATVPSLESNGPGSQSTPRQILDIGFNVSGVSYFIVDDNALAARLVPGFQFNVINSQYSGTYTVDSSVAVGTTTRVNVRSGAVATFGAITPGAGYVPGIYTNISLTGGGGTFAQATVTVNGDGTVHAGGVVLTAGGSGYNVGDSLTNILAGGGSAFAVVVATVTPSITLAPLSVLGVNIAGNTWTVEGVDGGACLFYPGSNFTITGNTGTGNGTYTVTSAISSAPCAITAVVTGVSGTITVAGNKTDTFFAGQKFFITGNGGTGDGLYLIAGAPVYSLGNTIITTDVSTPIDVGTTASGLIIPTPNVTHVSVIAASIPGGSTPDGMMTPPAAETFPTTIAPPFVTTISPGHYTLRWYIAGDHASRFVPGCQVAIRNNNVFAYQQFYIIPTIVSAGLFVVGTIYKIVSIGTTDFTLIGASSNTIGVTFTATGVGSGTGTASCGAIYNAPNTEITVSYTAPSAPAPSATGLIIHPTPVTPYGHIQYNCPVSSSLALIGKGSPYYNTSTSWGQAMQNNQIHALENFANSLPPAAPLSGQLWYDTSVPRLNLFGSTKYVIVSITPTPTNQFTVVGDASAVLTVGSSAYVYGNATLNTGTVPVVKYTIASSVFASGVTTVTTNETVVIGANIGALGHVYSSNDLHNVVIASPGFQAQSNLNMGGYKITNLSDPTVPSDAVTLQYANAHLAGSTSAGPGVNFFLTNLLDTTVGYHQISNAPDTVSGEILESVVVNSTTTPVMIDSNISDVVLDGSRIDPGVWSFNIYAYVDAAGLVGTNTVKFDVYKSVSPYAAGLLVPPYTLSASETLLFSVSTPSINNTLVELFTFNTAQPAFAVNPTDKLVIKTYVTSTNAGNTTVTLVHGGLLHYSFASTPLAIRHNKLQGLNGGTTDQYYHLTLSEYTGTGTGVFARQFSPTLAGVPLAPTAVQGTNSAQLATTAFVVTAVNGAVTSFNTRTGAVTLTSGDVTAALGYTPYNATNPAGYITSAGTATNFSGNLIGDVTGTQGATVVGKINGTSMAMLATGILKNTTITGVPSIAIAADFPTLNQNTTGTAATATAANALNTTTTAVVVNGAPAPTPGQVLTATSGIAATWQTPAVGGSFTTTDDTTTNATYYPTVVTTAGGSTAKTSSTKLTFNPSTGTLGITGLTVTGIASFNATNATDATNISISGTNTFNTALSTGVSLTATLSGGVATTNLFSLYLRPTFTPGAIGAGVYGGVAAPLLNNGNAPAVYVGQYGRVDFGAGALGGTIAAAAGLQSGPPQFDGLTTTNITSYYGVYAQSAASGASQTITNAYGFYSDQVAGAGRWGYYESTTANNAFAGNTRFGGTTVPIATVDITGSLALTGQLTSTISTGTAPFIVASTTPVLNLSIGGTAATATAANALNSTTTAVVVNGAIAPTPGQVLTATSGIAATWQTPVVQTSIAGITGTIAQFNTALTDGDFATLAGTETLTNKRITSRVYTSTSTATLTLDYSTYEIAELTAQNVSLMIANPTGVIVNRDALLISYYGTSTQTVAHGTEFRASSATALPTTTTLNKWTHEGYVRNGADTKWDLFGVVVTA